MTSISQSIRNKRYKFKKDNVVTLVVENSLGSTYSLKVINCSLSGIAGELDGETSSLEGLEIGSVVPVSKLVFAESEYPLGRLVMKQFTNTGTELGWIAGFLCIDVKIPLNGVLSKYLIPDTDGAILPFDVELSPEKFNISYFRENEQSNVDILGKCREFQVLFKDWVKQPKYQYYTVRKPSKGPRVNLKRSRRDNRDDYIVMGSNDYLGLAAHPKVMEAAKDAIDKYGFGSTGSPLTTGITDIHEELSNLLCKIFKKESVLLYNSGYAANVGTVPALTGSQDLLLADYLIHASIQDGMNMSKATARFFKHNDCVHLEKLLSTVRENHSGCLVLTEGVFSMDGDEPPLKEIIKIAKQYNARVFLDEAHSFGVIGENGLGLANELNVLNDIDILMGTFSKICGGIGGFVAGSKSTIDWLNWFSRSHMFSVSIPPSTAAAALASLNILQNEPQKVQSLKSNIQYFVKGLRLIGANVAEGHRSPVVPLVIGNEEIMGKINYLFMDAGVFVVPIVYPAVSRNSCRFRFTIMADHSQSDLDYVLNVIDTSLKKINFKLGEVL